ncbi:hypothetical protein R1flu_011340 [Riccia fluitans]|uniref:Aminotransferase-like plant mobile domain-containing protein n=1 Tax=Riccia fluitans TaxID=41844 RepID=A0ABD1Z7I6_9MARC
MAPCSHKNLKVKTKEVKIPHLTNANKKKMEAWGLGGLFAIEWSQTYEDLVEELVGHPDQKVAIPKYEYRWKPRAWISYVLREVYDLPKAILAPVRPEHFQHNQLAFYHYAWMAIKDPIAPTPNWGDAIEKTMSRQIKVLGVYNEATCLGPYLVHLYNQFYEMDNEEKEDSKKRKALEKTVSDSETETKDEKEQKEEFPPTAWVGEASRSKPLDKKTTVDFNKWGVHLQNLGWKTLKLFKAFHMEVGSVIAEAMTRNM